MRVEFAYDGGGPAKGGKLTLYLDGKPDGEGRIERTEPQLFSADETCDIGTEFGSPVTKDYARREFNGVVNWVQLDQGEDAKNAEHYIKPEEQAASGDGRAVGRQRRLRDRARWSEREDRSLHRILRPL